MKHLSLLLLVLSIIFSTQAQTPKIVAHRGGVQWGPENTLATILIAIEKGVDYVEIDVRQTKDGVFILMHDKDISRTTNGTGLVSELTYEEIQHLDAGSWYAKEFANEPIPTLSEVLKAINGKILPDIDFKAGDPQALISLLDENAYLDGRPLTLHSGNTETIKTIQGLTSQILVRPNIKTTYEDLFNTLNPPIINVSWSKYSKKLHKQIQSKQKQIFVNCLFLSNRKLAIKKALKSNVDFIQTDKLDFLLKLINQQKTLNTGEL